MKAFEYLKPESLDEAISTFNVYENAVLLGGGTDLMVLMKNDLIAPSCVIDLKAIEPMKVMNCKDFWTFGALTSVREIETAKVVQERLPFLSQAANRLGSIQIRNRATIGGNLCNASPAADLSTMLLAMGSQVEIVSSSGARILAIEDFFVGPNKTVLERGEILTKIIVPRDIENYKGIYLKFAPRKAMDIGIVTMALLMDANSDSGVCRRIKISLGAVAPTPIRAMKAEEFLAGKTLDSRVINKAADLASRETTPISDFRASADYRRELVKALLRKGIHWILNIV